MASIFCWQVEDLFFKGRCGADAKLAIGFLNFKGVNFKGFSVFS